MVNTFTLEENYRREDRNVFNEELTTVMQTNFMILKSLMFNDRMR